MTYSDELNKSAQKWADHLLSLGQLQHSGSQDGENIFFMSSSGGINLTGLFDTKPISFLLILKVPYNIHFHLPHL